MKKTLRLIMLLSGTRMYTCLELQDRLELSERSVYRLLEQLEENGFVVERTQGRYRLAQNNDLKKSMDRLIHFSEEEVYVFYRALSQVEEYEQSSKDLIRKLHALYDFQALSRIRLPDNIDKINAIKQGIKERKPLFLRQYHSSRSGKISDRRVEAFAFTSDYKSVWALDTADETIKQFKISRIQSVEQAEGSWTFKNLHQLPFTDAFRMSAKVPLAEVEAILSLKAYNLIKEEFPVAEAFITKSHPEYHLKIPVADYHGIGRFVLGLPGDVKVVSPEDFKEFLRNIRKKT